MKRHFLTGLKAFAVSVMTFLAVSCYDDSRIWTELEEIRADLDELAEKLTSEVSTINATIATLDAAYKAADATLVEELTELMEAGDEELAASLAALNEELDALDGFVDGYITSNDAALNAAIEEYKKADEKLEAVDTELLAALAGVGVSNVAKDEAGNVVITFTDKSTIEIPTNSGNAGLVTIVKDEDGVKYWAVVNEDGTATSLEVEVDPDLALEFKVGEDNALMYSVNGGEWVATEVVVKDDTTINVVEGFEYNEGDAYLTLTVGGVDYTLPVYKADTSSLVLGRTDFFIMYGAKKSVELKAEGIEEYYVMSKPDGWKANLEGATLYVTAPAKKTFELGAAETEGEVLVHATTAEGKCKVVKLNVETGDGLTLDLDASGNVVIKNAYTQVSASEMGEPVEQFASFYFGFATSELLDDPEAFFEVLANYYETPDYSTFGMFYNLSSFMERPYGFVPVENEIDVIETTLNDIYNEIRYRDIEYGSSFVFWVAPVDDKGVVIAEGAVYESYTHLLHEVEIDVTHNDATLNLNLKGASSYVVNVIEPWFEANGYTLEEYMDQMGEWMYIRDGYVEYLPVIPAGDYTAENAIKVSDLLGESLNFDSKYYALVFPYMEGVEYSDYKTQCEPYVYEFKTNPLQAGADYVAAVGEGSSTYTSVSVTITPQENTTVWYRWYTKEEYDAFESDNEVVADILGEYPDTIDYEGEVEMTYLKPGVEVVLAMISVGNDGKYGELNTATFKTKALPSVLDENLTVAVGTETVTYNSIAVTVTPAENTVVYYNFYSQAMLDSWETDADAASYTIQKAKAILTSATEVKATNLAQGTTQILVLVVLDVNNPNSFNVVKKTYKSKSYPYSDSITIALNDITYDAAAKTGVAVFDVTGDVTEVIFGCYYSGYTNSFESDVVTKGAPSSYFTPNTATVVDGKATIEFTANADWWGIYATAVVKADGVVTAMAKTTYSSTIQKALESLE